MGNLNFRTTPEQLTDHLAPAGEIVDVYFATDRDTGRPRGFAFVTFANDEQAAKAIEMFNGTEVDGRALNINEARERPQRRGPGQHNDSNSSPRPRSGRDDNRGSGPERREGRSGGGYSGPRNGGSYGKNDSFNNDFPFSDEEITQKGKPKKSKKGSRRRLRARKKGF